MLCFVCRCLLALTLLFSGFVKVADPIGMTYKLQAYATYWQLPYRDSMVALEMMAVCMGTIEFTLGLTLLLGIKRKFTSWVALWFMLLFTGLTTWIYLYNPVADCGCFGEAIELTNGESLLKNIVLLVFAVILCRYQRYTRPLVTTRNAWIITAYAWIYPPFLALYSLHFLPLIDFTPYKVGADIRAAIEGAPRPGDSMRLANFYLYDPHTGEDMTLPILNHQGETFLLTVANARTADDGCNDRINDIYDYAKDADIPFYMVTASDSSAIDEWIDRTGAAYPVLMAESTELKSMVRSSPGLLLLRDGVIIAKWSNNNLPETSNDGKLTEQDTATTDRIHASAILILSFLLPLLLLVVIDNLWVGHKYYRHHLYIKRFKVKRIMRKKIVAGNWKMNKTLQEGVALATELNATLQSDKPNCEVIICTPFIHLASVAGVIDNNLIGLGAENCADKESGAYTGEVSASMVKSTGAQYVILGHSERRAYYHETPEILKEKVNLALAHGLKVIFCIGEVLEERESGKQNEIVKGQLEGSLFDLTPEQFSQIILAYEPVWAIGTGKTATADQAEEMHAFIRQTIADKFGKDAAENVSILYGGSCKPSNAKELFSKVDVDGGLIGGAALKVADFKGIIDAWKA